MAELAQDRRNQEVEAVREGKDLGGRENGSGETTLYAKGRGGRKKKKREKKEEGRF